MAIRNGLRLMIFKKIDLIGMKFEANPTLHASPEPITYLRVVLKYCSFCGRCYRFTRQEPILICYIAIKSEM